MQNDCPYVAKHWLLPITLVANKFNYQIEGLLDVYSIEKNSGCCVFNKSSTEKQNTLYGLISNISSSKKKKCWHILMNLGHLQYSFFTTSLFFVLFWGTMRNNDLANVKGISPELPDN